MKKTSGKQRVFHFDDLANLIDERDSIDKRIMEKLALTFERGIEVTWRSGGNKQVGYALMCGGNGHSPRVRCHNYKTKKDVWVHFSWGLKLL